MKEDEQKSSGSSRSAGSSGKNKPARLGMRLFPETKIAIGLILSFLLVIGGTCFACVNSFKAIQTGKMAASGLELLAALESLLLVLRKSEEYSYRYMTSGDEKYAQLFEKESGRINAHVQFIKTLGATDKRRYVQITSLETQIRTLANKLTELLRLRKRTADDNGLSDSFSENIRQENLIALDMIRSRILYIESEEKELVKRGLAVYEHETRTLFKTYALLGVMVVLFFLGLTVTLLRYVHTTRRAAEAEKRVTNEILEHAPVGIMILDDRTIIDSINPSFNQMLKGREPDALIGRRLIDVAPASLVESVENLFILASSTDAKDIAVHSKEKRISGGNYWDISVWPIYEGPVLKGVIVQAFDVTDKVTINNQRQLLFNAFAHDLKNPLIGNQYLLKAITSGIDDKSDKDRQLLDQLARGNQDVLKMVQNILEISKMYENVGIIRKEPLEIHSFLSDCVSELQVIASQREVILDFRKGNDTAEAFLIETDRSALRLLVMNLLENAIKFSEGGQTVSLSLALEPEKVTIAVKDAGPGISEVDQRRLFTGIWQGEVGRRAPGGTGIGLYLCNQIAQALKGKISCASEEDKGTTFFVELPVENKISPDTEQAYPLQAMAGEN